MTHRYHSVAILVVLTALLALLAGCGGRDSIVRATPEATARAFVEAMQAGEYDTVSQGFEFDTFARRENPDWDTFGESQRRLIVGKLQEEKAGELRSMSGMFAQETTVGEAQTRDGRARVNVTAGANALTLHMTKRDDGWHLRRIEEATGE